MFICNAPTEYRIRNRYRYVFLQLKFYGRIYIINGVLGHSYHKSINLLFGQRSANKIKMFGALEFRQQSGKFLRVFYLAFLNHAVRHYTRTEAPQAQAMPR